MPGRRRKTNARAINEVQVPADTSQYLFCSQSMFLSKGTRPSQRQQTSHHSAREHRVLTPTRDVDCNSDAWTVVVEAKEGFP